MAASSDSDSNTNSTSALAVLIAACVSGFLFQFDLTALSAALPDIASSFSAQVSDQAWVISIYSFALIFSLPLAGPIADRYGKRRLFLIGIALFALSSAMCALATSFISLLAWRTVQGMAGALFTTSGTALVAAAYVGERRIWAFGILGMVVGASMVAGPPLGALIASSLGWQWVFWINLPICFALMLLASSIASDSEPLDSTPLTRIPLDWAGPATLAICMGSLAVLMLEGHEHGGSLVVL